METTITVTQSQLIEFLLNVAVVRPVFIWGPPGIGKSSLVEHFAHLVGLDCVSLLGSQLAPEDLISIPQILDGVSRFCPPRMIARAEPYCLFLDELNACSHEVQKAFYSLIHERRIGEYHLPEGSIVVGAGNRSQDTAIVKPMSSALINRMTHVHLKASHQDWLTWAYNNNIHQWVIEYIQVRPDHLWSVPPKHEAPFSTPRSWHMLSDGLRQFGDKITDEWLEVLAAGLLSPNHAQQFRAFVRQTRSEYRITSILKGESKWPHRPEERDILYFLSLSFRAHLIRELPDNQRKATAVQKELASMAKVQIKQLAHISLEMAQMVVSGEKDDEKLADWFLVEIVRDLPRLVKNSMAKNHKLHRNQHHKGKKEKEWLLEADEKFNEGLFMVSSHPLFAPIVAEAHVYRLRNESNQCPPEAWAIVTNNGDIYAHGERLAEPEEWAYIIAHCLLHLGFNHFQGHDDPLRWNVACDRVVARFLQEFKFGLPPEDMRFPIDAGTRDEEKLYQQLLQANLTAPLQIYSTVAAWEKDMVFAEPRVYWHGRSKPDWEGLFGHGLANAVMSAVQTVSGRPGSSSKPSESEQCKTWFLNHFPLLGALASTFTVIEDTALCQRMDISVAAVNAEAGEVYMNPASFAGQHDPEVRKQEYRFVMAHELLHVALRHHARRQGRDPYLWNVACDYVINGWLMEMQVGMPPRQGVLYDPQLKDMNAEAIYDRITNDLRMYRKKPSLQSKLERAYSTFGGKGIGDMLEGPRPDWWAHGEGSGLDDFYRRALAQGFQYHVQMGRGLIPAGLIEEIMAIGRPPIPWDVELAQWFDAHFPPLESRRTFARPSRRQSSTPDIPRPALYKEPIDIKSRTFGVVLDTSGSMDRTLLAKALGAIANYAMEREVPFVRVVFCDAYPYDQGYMAPEDIAGRVKVKGRGGTILMPGVELLERAEDFPGGGPILIITDTECDRVTIKGIRDAAFLIPRGRRLPFPTHAPVFYVE